MPLTERETILARQRDRAEALYDKEKAKVRELRGAISGALTWIDEGMYKSAGNILRDALGDGEDDV